MEKSYLTNNERIEITILRNFFFNEDFTRKALPFCKSLNILQIELKSYYTKKYILL